jgi:hypothetical protein
VLEDQNITSRIPARQIERAFDLKRQLRNIDKIFARVFRNADTPAVKRAGNGRKKKR